VEELEEGTPDAVMAETGTEKKKKKKLKETICAEMRNNSQILPYA
jgi:hypothetical protein